MNRRLLEAWPGDPVLPSATMMTHDYKRLWAGKDLFDLHFRFQSLMEGSRGKN